MIINIDPKTKTITYDNVKALKHIEVLLPLWKQYKLIYKSKIKEPDIVPVG